mgnify:FL=1
MDDSTFDRLVSEDVKNLLSPEKSDFLRLPENQERWKQSLLKLITNLDEQISDLTQDENIAIKALPSHMVTEYKINNDEKRTKISRFRFYVMQKISEVEKLIALGEEGATEKELSLAQFLKKAIEEHKRLMSENEFEPTPIDLALWSCTTGEWGFIDMDHKLTKWID